LAPPLLSQELPIDVEEAMVAFSRQASAAYNAIPWTGHPKPAGKTSVNTNEE
jgi:hypothetical protein